jgi:hypothetical protein
VVATVGLGATLAFAPGEAALAVEVWLLVVGTLALLLAIARTLGALPPERPTRLDASVSGRSLQTRPRELTKLERAVVLSTETVFDAYYRLRPTLREVAATRLRLRGVELDAPAGTAAALLGPEAWELVRPDRARPRDNDGAGLALERIAAVVDAVEQL